MDSPTTPQPKQNKRWIIVLLFGLVLFVVTNILFFILSIVAGTEQPFDYWWVGIIVALVMAACTWWLTQWLKPASMQQAFTNGIVWAIEIAVLLLMITIPNQTTSAVFGQWSTYLIFVGLAVGPLIYNKKP
ncbi:MAG: hypothetical protein HZC01_02980 [Candidatus Kerfeldbacteria bacterium]|nr:hypothetical protein [Candidatus Kerfeldbacteria bacterium]